jgi:hypothetical protein
VFERDYAKDITHMDPGRWLAWLGPAAAAGFLFGLATSLPFGKIRYLWSRLLLAALALAPLAQFWWVYIGHHFGGGLIARHMWFADAQSQTALAVLVGVALASGISARPYRGDNG